MDDEINDAREGSPASAERALQIGDWVADPALDELRRGAEIEKIEPRTMRLLMALARRPQQLVTQEQLLDEVWPDVVVSPSSVYQAISQLRGVLGDEASQPRYIATVPRKGYRLVAAVSEAPTEAAAPAAVLSDSRTVPSSDPASNPSSNPASSPLSVPRSDAPARAAVQPSSSSDAQPAPGPITRPLQRPLQRRWLLGGGAAATALLGVGGWWAWHGASRSPAGGITLAVLPFDDASPQALEQPLAAGLAESVIGALSGHRQIRVTSRETSFQFRSAQALAPQASQLAVTHVLWGELRRRQQGVDLKLSLHRAADSRVLWRDVLETPAAALGSLAHSVANASLQALGLTPLPAPAAPVPQADAYELYLLGLHHQSSAQMEGILKARAYFQRAIDTDPGFALAYVGQASTWIAEYHYGKGLGFRAMDARAQPLIDRALQLAPELPLALGLQGHLKCNLGQHEEARRWLARALAQTPSDASLLLWSGINETDDGWPVRAQELFAQAAQLSPLAMQLYHRVGVAATNAGRYESAETAYQRSIALAPQHPNGHWGLGIVGYARGRLAPAVLGYRKALLINPRREHLWNELAWLYLDLGLPEEAQRAYAQYQALSPTPAAARIAAAHRFVQAGDREALARALRLTPEEARAETDAVIIGARLQLVLGQPEAALQAMQPVVGLMQADPVPHYNHWLSFQGHHILLDVATVYTAAGQREQAEPFIAQAAAFLERYRRQGNVWHADGYHRARIAALRGQTDAALAALEEAFQLGWRRGWWLAQDPALAGLREQPRFRAVLAAIEQANQQQRQQLQV